MRHAKRAPSLATAALLSAALAGPALAVDPEIPLPEPKTLTELLKLTKSKGISTPWFPGHFHLAKRGLSYKHSLTVGERPVKVKLQGPVMKGGRFGLRFQVKF